MKILGISAFYHDAAAALLVDGQVVAAAQEERFTRKKHDPDYPSLAIEYCLKEGKLSADEIDYFVFYEKPFIKFERLLETYFAFAPRGFSTFRKSMPVWFQEKLFQKGFLRKQLKKAAPSIDWDNRLLFSEHHLSHSASAFFPSPFENAAVLTMDGVGEWTTTSLAQGMGNTLEIVQDIQFPHSIGLLYSAFTYYLGFKVNSGEYKVMGLAPYGEPKYAKQAFEHLIDIKEDGSFRLNMEHFDYCTGLTMTRPSFDEVFGIPRRTPEDELTQDHMDLAASVQAVTEEIVLRLARSVTRETGVDNLCLAGGVALNCVANGKIIRDGHVKNLWVQPAAGDAGGALGAALAAHYIHLEQPRKVTPGKDAMRGSYLGPRYSNDNIREYLDSVGAKYHTYGEENELLERCAQCLSDEMAMGWFHSRMEFGPRALGGRSIIADPRSPKMQSVLNLKIKYRESFRPFAPIVLREDVAEWFDHQGDSPYMLVVAPVLEKHRRSMTEDEDALFGIDKLNVPRSSIPAVTHVDYSARLQTVHKDTNPRLHRLLQEFKKKTGCPILVNTSFNVRGEPIVCSPKDAFHCFMGTEMDVLVLENFVLYKGEQDPSLKIDYKDKFELD